MAKAYLCGRGKVLQEVSIGDLNDAMAVLGVDVADFQCVFLKGGLVVFHSSAAASGCISWLRGKDGIRYMLLGNYIVSKDGGNCPVDVSLSEVTDLLASL